MGRRIQKKNRKKLKSVDPFNPNAQQFRERALQGKNLEPKGTDDQAIPRILKDIKEGRIKLEEARTMPKKKHNNKLHSELAKVGIQKRRFETEKRAIGRMHNTINKGIQEDLINIKLGHAGRDQKELEADFKAIATKERKNRERKLRERAKHMMEKYGEVLGKTKKRLEAIEKADTKKKKRKNLSKVERKKLKEKEKGKEDDREEILNAREVIEFGDRYDAPPEFKGELKQKIDPLMAKAGGKSLLLHDLYTKAKKVEKKEENPKSEKLQQMERQQVVDAYREIKRKRREEMNTRI